MSSEAHLCDASRAGATPHAHHAGAAHLGVPHHTAGTSPILNACVWWCVRCVFAQLALELRLSKAAASRVLDAQAMCFSHELRLFDEAVHTHTHAAPPTH